MTVSTTSSSVVYQGNGATTIFPFSFVAVAASYLTVSTTTAGVITVLPSSAYTVSLNAPVGGALWGVGGTVTYNPPGGAIPTGTYLTIARALPLTQNTSISNQTAIYLQVIEQTFDQVVMALQQVSAGQALALQAPVQDGALNMTLPPAAMRAGQGLMFDANGLPITGALSAAPVSAAMQPVVDAATTALGLAAMGGATTTALAAETTRAEAAEAANTTATGVVSTALGAETTRAEAAEAAAVAAANLFSTAHSVTGSRALNTVYTNSTGKPMIVVAWVQSATSATESAGVEVGGTQQSEFLFTANGYQATVYGVVPPGAIYEVYISASINLIVWTEIY